MKKRDQKKEWGKSGKDWKETHRATKKNGRIADGMGGKKTTRRARKTGILEDRREIPKAGIIEERREIPKTGIVATGRKRRRNGDKTGTLVGEKEGDRKEASKDWRNSRVKKEEDGKAGWGSSRGGNEDWGSNYRRIDGVSYPKWSARGNYA